MALLFPTTFWKAAEEPPSESLKLTIGESEGDASEDYNCPTESCPFSVPPGTDAPYSQQDPEQGFAWILIQVAEDAPEEIDASVAFTTEGFFTPGEALEDGGLVVANNSGSTYLPQFSFNGIGNLIPGETYQLSIKQDSEINPAAYEGLEGKITIVE